MRWRKFGIILVQKEITNDNPVSVKPQNSSKFFLGIPLRTKLRNWSRCAPGGDAQGIPDLLRGPSWRGVGDGPGRLFPRAEFCFLQDFNQHRENVGIYDCLGREGRERGLALAALPKRSANLKYPSVKNFPAVVLVVYSFIYPIKSWYSLTSTAEIPGIAAMLWEWWNLCSACLCRSGKG